MDAGSVEQDVLPVEQLEDFHIDPFADDGSELNQDPMDGVLVRSSEFLGFKPQITDFTPVADEMGVRLERVYNSGDNDPPEDTKRKIFKSILHQITVQRKPVYRCQLPIFCLEPRSLTEKLTDFFAYGHLLLPLNDEPSAEKRFLGVLKFYLSAWHLQIPPNSKVKNPLNPILGEVYRAQFGSGDDRFDVLCEQITHHPPSSAFAAWNRKNKVSMEAYIRPDIHFSGNLIETYLVGELVGHLYGWDNERYVCSYPKYVVHGIIFGTMQMELGGKSSIVCNQTGYSAEIEFKSTGQLASNTVSDISVKVFHVSDKKKILHYLTGNWDSTINIAAGEQGRRGSVASATETLFLDVRTLKESPKFLPAREEMLANESRKVWGQVAAEILAKDEPNALKHKTEIEEIQRAKLADRKKRGVEWHPKYFQIIDETWKFPGLREIFEIPDRQIAPSPSPEKSEKEKGWFRRAFGK